jgi:SNF2 family DNA or RNA helicase
MPSLRPLWTDFSYFQHQLEGINWMLGKEIDGTSIPNLPSGNTANVLVRGGFQCDDMGLGKTIQISSVIVNNPLPCTLLIAPLAMIRTWSDVLQRTGCAVYEIVGNIWNLVGQQQPIPRHFIKNRPAIYISNYEKLYSKPSLFQRAWDRCVLDEAHKIRNGDGQVARSCRKISAPIRWAVTGTPLVNSLKDVVSLMAFIGVPYSKLWRWEARYLRILPEIVIHRSINSLRPILKDAPPIPIIHNVVIPFTSQEEEEFYFGVQGANESLIRKYAKELINPTEAFKLLLRLRQISVHPQVYINSKRREDIGYNREDWIIPSSKLEKIREIIQTDNINSDVEGAVADKVHTLQGVHKYIIFCQFNDEMSLIREFLLNEGLVTDDNILLYNGSMNQAEREAVLKRSKATTELTVLLLQLQAGGVGLNLQEYDRIIFVSPWWTSALMDQAIARAVRMGQKEIVHVYHLRLAAESAKAEAAVNIDELVNAKAEEKRKMLEKLFVLCEHSNELHTAM